MAPCRRLWSCIAILALLSLSQVVHAQETTGRIEGRILDAASAPVPFVNITVSSPSLQGQRGTQTDESGGFRLLALPVGEYSVRLSHLSYEPDTIRHVQVALGQATNLGVLRFQERVYLMNEVVVSGRSALLDTRSTLLGDNLSARDYEALPVDRDYKSVARLAPHATSSGLGDPVNFAGATGLENRYFVDGMDVTDPFRTATGTRLPYNFIEEVQVRIGGYEAEYRSSLGGTVNAVTYSGGNQMTGQVFGFYTGNGFSATPRSVPGNTQAGQAYALYDFGFGLGGPIRSDRLWYYAAYNPSVSSEDVNIPGWGTYRDHATTHSFAGKLTWRADDANTFTLTALGDPVSGRQVNPPPVAPAAVDPFLFDIRQGGESVMLEGRHLLGPNLLLQSSLSRLWRTEKSNPATTVGRTQPYFSDSAGVVSGGGARNNDESVVNQVALHATWTGQNQEVKAGLEYRDNRLDFDSGSDIVIQSSSILYYRQVSSFLGHVGARQPSFFLQHTWRPTERLTVNDGLRWDGQYWISSADQVAQTILDQWQPRVGLTYQPGRAGTQKIYASFGRFYQDITTSPLFWYYNKGSRYFSGNYDHDPRLDPAGADTLALLSGAIQPRLQGLQGQYFDEFTLGYERHVARQTRLAMRCVQRILRQGIEDGFDLNTGEVGLANPGIGALRTFPPMTRRYTALEISLQGQSGGDLSYLASYVLSRNFGDHEGLFDSRLNNPFPNATGLYDVIYQTTHASGHLPNDRTHEFKLAGSYRIGYGLTVGAVGEVASGTPVSEFGGTPIGSPYFAFIGPRGSHGRTPAVWNLDLRIGYQPRLAIAGRAHTRVTLDLLHVASQRKAIRYDEVHYRALDGGGGELDPNPNWRMPIAFQPPMAVRLGVEAGF